MPRELFRREYASKQLQASIAYYNHRQVNKDQIWNYFGGFQKFWIGGGENGS